MVNNMRLKKGSKEAKAFMAKLRAAKNKPKKVGASYDSGSFKVLGKKNNQLVEISAQPMTYEDAKKFIKNEGIEKYYTNVDIIPYRGNKKTVKYIGGWNKGGTYIIESGEKKPAKAKKVISVTRRKVVKAGTFKKFSRVGATQHKDTKSHNVNIRVLSGVNKMKKYDYEQLENINLTRVKNDVYGNPRYVLHFLDILNKEEQAFLPFAKKYEYALKKAKLIGGRKFHNKQYGGGIVFQSYNTDNLKENIIDVLETTPKIKY